MTSKRYCTDCECCKYNKEFELHVSGLIHKDLGEEDLQTICSTFRLSITKPEEWTAVPDSKVCERPAIYWALFKQGFIDEWSQRPCKLQQILTGILDRVDLATKHQELLGKHACRRITKFVGARERSAVI